MNALFKKRQLSFLLQLVLFTVLLYGVHSYITHYFVEQAFFFNIWQIYVFLFLITMALYTVVNYKESNGQTAIFNIFMVATFLKMILAIIFLLPLLLSAFENKKPDVFNFFIPYFLFLIFEVYTLNYFLQKK